MMKFKVGFTISSEELFRVISRMFPQLEDVQIEEMIEKPPRTIPHAVPSAILKPLRKPGSGRTKRGVDINKGGAKIVLDILADRKHHNQAEFREAMIPAGLSKHAVGSLLVRLLEHDLITKVSPGTYHISTKALGMREKVA